MQRRLIETGLLVGVLGTYAILYFLNNNFQIFELWHVPRTFFDEMVTFSPYWIWIYLMAYILPVFMFFYLQKLKLQLHFLKLFFILTIITNLVFFLVPSTIDRVPVPTDGVDFLTKLAFEILFSTDKPSRFQLNPELHTIGAFLPSPQSNTINVTSRNCSTIPGTTFIPTNCKTVNLNGIFFDQVGTITFNGTYSIADEVTADSCTYTMSLTREVTY